MQPNFRAPEAAPVGVPHKCPLPGRRIALSANQTAISRTGPPVEASTNMSHTVHGVSHTAVLSKIPHCNSFKSVPNRPLRGRRGRFGTILQQLQCGENGCSLTTFERPWRRVQCTAWARGEAGPGDGGGPGGAGGSGAPRGEGAPQRTRVPRPRRSRSEERRVGKECRSRWSPYH